MDSEIQLFWTVLLFVSGIIGILMLYYAVSLQSLNSTQLERLFKTKSKPAVFNGLKISIIIMGVRVAAVFCEVLFFLSMAMIWFQDSRDLYDIIVFLVIGLLLVSLSRVYLPMGFPLQERETLNSLETSIFTLCGYFFFPIGYVLDRLTQVTLRVLFPKTEDERISQVEEAIKSIIDVGETGGIFQQEEGELLQSIVDFSEMIVREVMTPRIDIHAIEITETLEAAVRIAVETNYSKIPAFRERIDNIEGILYSKDLLKYWDTDQKVRLEDIVRPAYFVPETKKVRNLLREFQKEKIHMAIVVDEYGGAAGVVTLEDLLEEIVGEIHDEYDDEEELIRSTGENTWIVDAKVDLEELGDVLGIEFPENNYETLGGFLFDQMGRVPLPGEKHQFQTMEMEIKEANERRIVKVIIRKFHKEMIEPTEADEQTSNL